MKKAACEPLTLFWKVFLEMRFSPSEQHRFRGVAARDNEVVLVDTVQIFHGRVISCVCVARLPTM